MDCSMPLAAEGVRRSVRAGWLPRLLAGLALVGLLAAGLAAARLYPAQIAALASQAAHSGEALGITGWLIAACVQTLIALCGILPASVGGFAMGMAYGVVAGFLLSGVATLVGAVLAFALARSLFRPWIEGRLSRHPRMRHLDEAVCRDGWRLVALMRLSPVMPFAVTSYALGLTSLGLRAYLVGTLASLPALLGYVAMGHFAKLGVSALSGNADRPWHWAFLAIAVLATGLLTLRLATILRLVMRLPEAPDADATGLQTLPGQSARSQ
jgi:uncharacterized membrane protein YdjX (TVP38/TMEM64 family)